MFEMGLEAILKSNCDSRRCHLASSSVAPITCNFPGRVLWSIVTVQRPDSTVLILQDTVSTVGQLYRTGSSSYALFRMPVQRFNESNPYRPGFLGPSGCSCNMMHPLACHLHRCQAYIGRSGLRLAILVVTAIGALACPVPRS